MKLPRAPLSRPSKAGPHGGRRRAPRKAARVNQKVRDRSLTE